MVQVQSISDTGTSEGGADWMGCAYNSTFMVWVSGLSNQLNHVSFTVKLSLRYTILQINFEKCIFTTKTFAMSVN